jgi:hypothetical protein
MRFIFASSSQPATTLQKIIRILVGLVVVAVVLTIAAFLFVYITISAVAVLCYWWLKTRNTSEDRTTQAMDMQGGNVIEGEIISDSSTVPTVLLGEVTTTVQKTYGNSDRHNP